MEVPPNLSTLICIKRPVVNEGVKIRGFPAYSMSNPELCSGYFATKYLRQKLIEHG
jgi:hypothetical protein